MLSNTCKYAIRAVIYLAVNYDGNNMIGIKQIAKDLELPSPFLGKILQTLAKQKLISSFKGPHGGFGLIKPASEIKLIDIVEIIDGLDVFNNCIVGLAICKNEEDKKELCPFHLKSDPIRNELYELFKNQTIGDLATNIKAVEKLIYY